MINCALDYAYLTTIPSGMVDWYSYNKLLVRRGRVLDFDVVINLVISLISFFAMCSNKASTSRSLSLFIIRTSNVSGNETIPHGGIHMIFHMGLKYLGEPARSHS